MSDPDSTAVPYGYCECGCGERTTVSKYTYLAAGRIKGRPVRFVHGHNSRTEARPLDTCDHSFFDSVDNEVKAYWLGFLAADGCIANSHTITVGLAAYDHDHLLRFKAALGSSHLIRTYMRGTYAGSFENSGPTSRIQLPSKQLTSSLIAHGVLRRKSDCLDWPENLAPDLLRHYLRGYFDGDGWFTSSMHHACKRPQFFWRMNGTESFCLGAQAYLMKAVGARRTKLRLEHRCEGTYLLSYGGNRQVKRIYGLMYEGATVWLPRKRDRAVSLFN